MKGVFGEGASVVAVPDAMRAANVQQARAAQLQAAEARQAPPPEQLQRRAQSRGLWTDGGEVPTAPSSQPRAGTLPRAVVGTPSPASAANTNYRSPSIGTSDSQPPVQPRAAELHEALVQSEPAPMLAEPSIPAPESRPAPKSAAPLEEVLPERKSQPQASKPAAAKAPAPAPVQAPSSPNTTLLLALILIAAIVAVLFIGAAVGLWGLPWGKGSTGRSPLSKAIPAKSLPEMRPVVPVAPAEPPAAAAPAEPVVAAPAAAAAPAAPAAPAEPQPTAAEPAPAAPPSAEATSVMEAEEAAPLRAPALSGPTLEEITDLPNPEAAQAIATARAALKAGRPKDAEAVLRPLLDKNPDDYHVAEVLAQALLARGAAVEAVGLAQRIVKKRPKRASYRVLLGDALRRAGDEPSAKLAYKEALSLDPKMREAQKRLKSRKLPAAPAPAPAAPTPAAPTP